MANNPDDAWYAFDPRWFVEEQVDYDFWVLFQGFNTSEEAKNFANERARLEPLRRYRVREVARKELGILREEYLEELREERLDGLR